MQHAQELRIRILISLGIIAVVFSVLLTFHSGIMQFLSAPLTDLGYKLHSFKVYEAFVSIIKAAFFAAVIFSAPVWIIVILGFIVPALEKKQKIVFFIFTVFSFILLFAGLIFSYKILIPISLHYLLSFGALDIEKTLSIGFYLDYFIALFFLTGIGFQLPLVQLLLAKLDLLDYKTLSKGRKYAIVIIFVVSAVITPPDIISQVALGVPLCVLYELGLVLILLFNRKKEEEI